MQGFASIVFNHEPLGLVQFETNHINNMVLCIAFNITILGITTQEKWVIVFPGTKPNHYTTIYMQYPMKGH